VIDINRLLQRLCDANIDFVIVGGFAATLHGSSLVTRDLDVCAILSSENVAKLRDALRDLKPAHRLTSQKIFFWTTPNRASRFAICISEPTSAQWIFCKRAKHHYQKRDYCPVLRASLALA
jgi:hypothetical protein